MSTSDNLFEVTICSKSGEPFFPGVYKINGTEAVFKYGITGINKNGLLGVWVPFDDLPAMRQQQEVTSGA